MNFSESKPDGLRAGFAISFAAQEATQLCDQAKHLIELGLGGLLGLGEQVCAADLVDIEEQFGVQSRAAAAHAHQISDTPSHYQEQRQSAFESFDRAQLQGLDAASVLQHIEQNLDFPARAVPVNEFGGLLQRRRFAVQWWADAHLLLPATLWHFHPIEFIDWMSSCRWIDKSTLSRIYSRTPEGIREKYRVALNKVMQKYVFIDAVRQAHFLGQGAIESGSLQNMQEASMLNNRINPASVESEAALGHWYRKKDEEFDGYYSSEKFNSKGHRITGSYSWINGNVGDADAQEFRGRGFKQLTGRANYAAYWVYRGWLKTKDFDDGWWLDHAYKQHNAATMKKRPALIAEPDRVIRDPYNCIDSGGFFVAIKNDDVKREIDTSRGIVPSTDEERELEKKISEAVTHIINGGYIEKDGRYLATMNALKVLN